MSRPHVIIYTDGACSPNPGIGGWAAILISPAHGGFERAIQGAEAPTTNNRMELTAAVQALSSLKKPCSVVVHTDSEYLQKAFTEGWLTQWSQRGWRTKRRDPVANTDLWKRLLELASLHDVRWEWTKGHADDANNVRCDRLAVEARERLAVASTGGTDKAESSEAYQ